LTLEQIQNKTQIQAELLLELCYGLLKKNLLIFVEINENESEKDFKITDIKMDYTQVKIVIRSHVLRQNTVVYEAYMACIR
jgi:hypothetical protein